MDQHNFMKQVFVMDLNQILLQIVTAKFKHQYFNKHHFH